MSVSGEGTDQRASNASSSSSIAKATTKVCLLIRHTEDADPRLSLQPDKRWQDDAYSLVGRDPVLTSNGIVAARNGFTDEEARELRPGYRGVRGGLQSKVMAFQPTLVVTSPLRRSLLTAAFACENCPGTISFIAHPNLRELKSSKVHARSPKHVKPGAHGVPFTVLQETLSRAPCRGNIDLSLVPKGRDDGWHDVSATPEESKERALLFLDWLKNRSEERVVIFTHGKVLRLPRFGGISFLHGEVRQFHFDGHKMVHDPSFEMKTFDVMATVSEDAKPETKEKTLSSNSNPQTESNTKIKRKTSE